MNRRKEKQREWITFETFEEDKEQKCLEEFEGGNHDNNNKED
jgi:hypothetical protein